MTEGAEKVDLYDPIDRSETSFTTSEDDATARSIGSDVSGSVGALFVDSPPVKAIVIAEHADAHLAEVLSALDRQTYDNLSVTVLNATGDPSLAEALGAENPDAAWVEMPTDSGFASLANWSLEKVDPLEYPFLLVVKDTTALAPAGVSYLLEEMYRSNAGVVGPKLVAWDDPSKLLAVGYGADRRGRQIDLIEADEFDQDQYDSVSDVFVIPAGVQLIRSDLFMHLGGFDSAMAGASEDLDFCWRAHTVAARVIVVPQAVARQSRPIPSKNLSFQLYRRRCRYRLRTLIVTSSRWSFPLSILGAVASLVLAAIGNVIRGRPAHARAALGAIAWNVRRMGSAFGRRRALRSIRLVGGREIHALQSRIGPSVGSLVERSVRPTGRLIHSLRLLRASLVDERQRVGSSLVAFLGFAALLILLGNFGLLRDDPVVVGHNPILGEGRDLMIQWWSGYRTSGIGGSAAAPASFAVLGALEMALSWSNRFLFLTLLVGPLVLAAVGAFRLVRPLGSARAAAIATALAVANPLTGEALAAARWDTLVQWGFAPYLLVSVARVGDIAPWNSVRRSLPVRLTRFGVLLAVVAAFAPSAIVIGLLASVAVVAFGVVTGRVYRIGYGLAGLAAAVVVPAAMHLPFTRDVLVGGGWEWIVGPSSAEANVSGFSEILLFAPGRSTGSVLMYGLLAAASLGLFFGRGTRFDAAVLGWSAALVGFAGAWLASSRLESALLPGSDVFLVIAGAGLTLAVGSSVRSVEVDLKRYKYGWRQFATLIAAVGGLAVLVLGFGHALDGRHNHPEVGYAEITALLPSDTGEARVLWLGDPRVVSVDMAMTPSAGIDYAITSGDTTTIADRFLPSVSPATREVGVILDVAFAGDTVRLGRMLAPFGVDYVIYQPQLAPAPYDGPSFDIDATVDLALSNQLDLRRQPGTLNLIVFRNEASKGTAVVLDESFDTSDSSIVDLLDSDLSTGIPLVPESRSPVSVDFAADPATIAVDRVLLAQPVDGWVASAGVAGLEGTVGGLTVVEVGDPGQRFGIEYRPPTSWWLWLGGQLAIVVIGLVVATRSAAPTHDQPRTGELVLDLTELDTGRAEEAQQANPEPVEISARTGDPT